jgi:predicted anti-sigma-YlaC factor YlaD
MTGNVHARAKQLLAKALIEGVGRSDEAWLKEHLSECTECSREAASTEGLVRGLRRVPIALPNDLVARTQMRVRLRSQEIAERSNSGFILWVLTAVSWLLGVLSAPLVWHGFAWLGEAVGVPKLILEMGFTLWWIVPALFAVAAVLHQRGLASAAKR